jgi:hypothetical protein
LLRIVHLAVRYIGAAISHDRKPRLLFGFFKRPLTRCAGFPRRGDPELARETAFIVQAYDLKGGKTLKADKPVACKSADAARRMAERLAPAKAGVVAFSASGDAELGEFDDEPVVLFKAGRLLPPYDEASGP